jgi:creatinine amidohydrolase
MSGRALPGAEGRRLLAQRAAQSGPALIRALAAPLPVLPRAFSSCSRFVATGLGSSEAHARYFASLLSSELGLDARFRPLGEFLGRPPQDAAQSALVVFSQGLSPNARFALAAAERWGGLVVCSAVAEERCDAERRAWLRRVRAAGGGVVALGDAETGAEFGTLVRLIGPLLGYAAALRIARALALARGLGVPPSFEPAAVELSAALDRAPRALARAFARAPADVAGRPLAFLASGDYAERVANLPLKWMEGLLRPRPPIFDPLAFAHGPLQQAYGTPLCLVALERPDAPREAECVAALGALLDASRHSLVRLRAELASPCAVFEHEAMLNAWLLERCEAEAIDPSDWPARGADAALYSLSPEPAARAEPGAARGAAARALAAMRWPELEGAIAAGARTAIVPLGAFEQHGPHLPFATDTWIADALAERVCERVPAAIRIPALALGCSEEHADFPGTLSLQPPTLRALLADLLRSLARAGFARALVFSAHGGNDAWLRVWEPELAASCAPLALVLGADLGEKSALSHELAVRAGVAPEAAGHHAGEFETSILLALAPAAVARGELRAGRLAGPGDAQALFYPSLRPHAPEGTVGDPTQADPARAAAYLDAWAELLVAKLTERAPR